ncbi:AraC family transcriptional regulator [Paenibacillus aceti]|nr:AraC family transcriptional regulator [Paenibacillus aceti]
MMIDSKYSVTDFHPSAVRLWDVDFFHRTVLNMEQQLAIQNVLIIILKGELDLDLKERTIRISEGDIRLCPSGSTFGVRSKGSHGVTAALFHFSLYQADTSRKDRLIEMEDVAADMFWTAGATTCPAENLQAICRKVYRHFHHSLPHKQWRAQLDFQELLYELLTESGGGDRNDKVQAIERAKAYIEDNYSEELTVNRLADVADFSPKYFADLFKKTYGYSAMEYVTRVRMNKAKQLMLGSDVLLKEVAHLVGYKDEFYFSRKFKKEVGLSPSSYVKERGSKIALYGSTSLLGYLTPLQIIPYAAPLHPKWSAELYHTIGPEIPIHLDAYRQNHNKEANLTKLEAAQPERIICPRGLEPWEKQRLEQIAPVDELSLEEDWRGELTALAGLLGRRTEAEQWLHAFEQKISRLRQRIAEHTALPTLVTVRVFRNQFTLYNSPAVQEVLYNLLGCSVPSSLPAEPFVSLAIEQLGLIEAGHIFVLVRQDTETLAYWRELSSSAAWMSLPAVREGRTHLITSYPWREYSPASIEHMAEAAAQLLTEKNP